MIAPILNLLNGLRKSDKMRGNFYNPGARMLHDIKIT